MAEATATFKVADYKTEVHPDWCPGCGDFGIVNCVQQAMADLQLKPWEVMVFSGVGCSSKTPHFMKTYGIHTLHGRVLPFALGAKLANPAMTVVATGGDGDGYGIGCGHFVHAGRRNVDIAYIVYDNEVYGLTKGQASPTLSRGDKPKSLPLPNPNEGINPIAMALCAGYTFIARSYAFDGKHLKEIIKQAIQHPGMALVNVLQPCPTYNDLHNREYFSGKVTIGGKELPRTYKLEEIGYDGRVKNSDDPAEVEAKRKAAFEKSQADEERIALGIFYQIHMPTYYERLAANSPVLKEHSPATISYMDAHGRPTTDLSAAIKDVTV